MCVYYYALCNYYYYDISDISEISNRQLYYTIHIYSIVILVVLTPLLSSE